MPDSVGYRGRSPQGFARHLGIYARAVTIHSEHPFLEPDRDPVRRLRGRLGGAVTLWTSGAGEDPSGWSGLTVTSLMVAGGEPGRVLALLDPDSDLADALADTGSAVVNVLTWADRDLAEAFAGTMPAPGGAFGLAGFEPTRWGPRLARAATWAGVRREGATDVGWSSLVTCVVEEVVLGGDEVLVHRRGRYQRPTDGDRDR
jgi:flavin reductase (DIM6/NTAB) family NADH-FMN oxidoreductase RutF